MGSVVFFFDKADAIRADMARGVPYDAKRIVLPKQSDQAAASAARDVATGNFAKVILLMPQPGSSATGTAVKVQSRLNEVCERERCELDIMLHPYLLRAPDISPSLDPSKPYGSAAADLAITNAEVVEPIGALPRTSDSLSPTAGKNFFIDQDRIAARHAKEKAETRAMCDLRLDLRANGYQPVPITSPTNGKVSSPGKAPLLKNWQNICATASDVEIAAWSTGNRADDINTGLLCGKIIAIDIDILDAELALKAETLAVEILGATPLRRVGRAPKSLLVYRADEAGLKKLETAKFIMPCDGSGAQDQSTAQIEILATGQQFVGFGIHPGTQRPYDWTGLSPLDVQQCDLPAVTRKQLQNFISAAETMLWEADARSDCKTESKASALKSSALATSNLKGTATKATNFFKNVNSAALDDLSKWVPMILPGADLHENTGAWRISAKALGDNFEEDLSIAPSGIRYFGSEETLTPIDVAQRWGDQINTPSAAAHWLCQSLGIEPKSLGWVERSNTIAGDGVNSSHSDQDNDDEAVNEPDTSDHDMAREFADRFGTRLRYIAALKQWLVWDDRRWAIDSTESHFRLMTDFLASSVRTIIAMLQKDNKPQSGNKAPSYEELKNALKSANKASSVLRVARTDTFVRSTLDQWDVDPFLLNTPDGIVDLKTGRLRPHEAALHMTKITPAGHGGSPARFLEFLNEITGGNIATIDFLQRYAGYCLTGSVDEQVFAFLNGGGQNGKGVLTSALSYAMGDYAMVGNLDLIVEKAHENHPADLARLRGARLVAIPETERNKFFAEARLKAITGGDAIAARGMHQDWFEYQPQFKFLIAGNDRPRLRSVDKAIRRRLILIPLNVEIAEDRKDPRLLQKLQAEAGGILQWMIDGCLAWQRMGLALPPEILAASAAYFQGEDMLGQWIAECCHRQPSSAAYLSELYESWSKFANEEGLKSPGTKNQLSKDLDKLGFKKDRGEKGVRIHGLTVSRF